MNIKYIEWRNIKSFGNKLQKIELLDEGGLWMILGKVGNGKTALLELPKLAYYGKLDRFKKDEIANRLNKRGYIKLVDQTGPESYVTIERGFSPSELRVYKHNELNDELCNENDIGKAGITDYQDYIDLEVTGLPYHIFSNVISLSINDFKSFISMTPHDKRIIIDKLFAMEIINKMNELVKKDLREIKTHIDLFDRESQTLKNNVEIAINELQKLKDQVSQDNSEKIIQLAKQLETYKPKLKQGYDKKKQWEDKRDDIQKAQRVLIRQKAKLAQELTHLRSQIDLFNSEKCPTCATPFNDTRFDLIKGQLQEDIKNKNEEIIHLRTDEDKYAKMFLKVNQGLTTINNFIIQVKTTYNTIESEMNKLKLDKPKEFESIQNIISENTIKLTGINEGRIKEDESFKYLSILEQLYSDMGIKKKIMESYLPILNKEIAYTLNEFHFPYNLSFNSDFEPELYHFGIEVNAETLSTGEKKVSDLAVLISFIRMMKRKYPKLNIFMLDEVLSSLDSDKIYDVLSVLKNTAKDLNINIFVVNHALLPVEYFDYVVRLEKNAGFSDVTIEKLDESSTGD